MFSSKLQSGFVNLNAQETKTFVQISECSNYWTDFVYDLKFTGRKKIVRIRDCISEKKQLQSNHRANPYHVKLFFV